MFAKMNARQDSRFILNSIFIFLVLINECLGDSNLPEKMVKMKTVKDRIMNGYDKLIRPGSNSTEVFLEITLKQIIDVDETASLFVMDSILFMHWQDPRVKWDRTEYNGTLIFPQDVLWMPDITVYNSHSLTTNPMQDALVVCHNNGYVTWYPPIHTQTSCPDLMKTAYPYGEVMCNITLGSWAHDEWQINFLHMNEVYMDMFVNSHSRWELLTDKANVTPHFYKESQEQYWGIEYSFTIRRRPLPEIEATRIPCILVMLLTLSVFWLPPNSSKKVLVLGFQFLILTVLIVYVAWSTKFPLGALSATSFLRSTMYIVVATFLLQILVIFNLCNLSGPSRPPPLAMQLLTGPFGKYACLRWPLNNNLPMDRVQLNEDSSATIDSPTARDDWMLFAAGLDRLFFVVASVAMIAVHHL